MSKFLASLTALVFSLNAFSFTLKDLGEEMYSPIEETPGILTIGSLATLTALALRNPHVQNFEDGESGKKRLSHYSTWGDYAGQLIPNALYSGYQAYLGYNGDTHGYRRSIGMIKATTYAGVVTSAIKYTVRAPRPNNNSVRNSFPSGHSATIFTFAGYVLNEHGILPGALSLALAGYCGYSRVHDKMHRVHEVFAGATIGLAYGISISRHQREKINQRSDSVFNGFTIAPIFDMDAKGVSIYKEF